MKKENVYRDYDIAYDYATKVYQKFREVVKSIVLFGSTAKETQKEKSDVDIIIIVDDVLIRWDQELIAWYREELGKLTASLKYPKKLHVNTVTLSTFWNELLVGEPVVINVIRYGVSLIDFGGFFEPLKVLLARGRIKPSPEAIYNALRRAPFHMSRSNASLMAAKQVPPSPEHIPSLLNEVFVKKGMLKDKYVDWYKEIYAIAHHLSHGETAKISGKFIEMYQERADKFIGEMANLVKELE